MFLDENTGEFIWTPQPIVAGDTDQVYDIEFVVRDIVGNESMPTVVRVTVVAPTTIQQLSEGEGGVFDIVSGQVLIYDDNGSESIAEWTNVYSRDYSISGNVVLDNGVIRVFAGKLVDFKQVIEVYDINEDGSNGRRLFVITPINESGLFVGSLNEVKV